MRLNLIASSQITYPTMTFNIINLVFEKNFWTMCEFEDKTIDASDTLLIIFIIFQNLCYQNLKRYL